jgi:hypothetical protein
MTQTLKLPITEAHLYQAQLYIKETNDEPCHCVVATAIFEELGVPVIDIGYTFAKLADGRMVKWSYFDTFAEKLIQRFDKRDFRGALKVLPYLLPISISTKE